MSWQGGLWQGWGTNATQYGRVRSDVVVGDLAVFTVGVENYLLRDGQSVFEPSDLLLPPGWSLVDWWVAIPGGDPRRIALVQAVVARVADASTRGSDVSVRTAVPFWEADQDPGSARVTLDATMSQVHGGRQFSGLWRGEKGVASVQRWAMGGPAHSVGLPPGASRDGGASVAQWASWMWGGASSTGSWRSVDSNVTDAQAPARSGNNPVISSEGASPTLYYWRTIWSGSSTYVSDVSTAQLHAITVSVPSYPLAPVITAPPGGALLDLEHDGVTVAWRHRPSLAGPQAGWALRRTLGSDVKYWNAAGKVWSSTLVKKPGVLSSVDLPASVFPGGTGLEHRFEVATYGANLELSMWSSPVTVTGVLKPSASVSFVGVDMAGSLASLRPQVIVGGSSPAGLALVAWSASLVDVTNGREVATGSGVFDAAGQVTWAPDVEVDNGVTVQAVVRVQQAGGAWSAPATAQAVVDVDVPGIPTLAVTTGTHEVSGAPSARVRVDFPWETDGYAWSGRATVLRLERLDRGEWVTVAEVMLPLGRTSAVLDDYAASAGELTYRARGEGQAVDGSRLIGAWGYSTPTTINVPGGWIIDPAAPERSLQVSLTADESRKLDLRTVTMEALGRDEVLTAAGTPLLESGSTTVRVNNAEHRARVLTLLTSGTILKLTFCPERDVFADGARQDAESLWFRPVGDVDTSRVVSRGPWALRHVSWSWVSQRPPVLRRAEVG